MTATKGTQPGTATPADWSADYFGLIEDGERPNDRLARCTAHHGEHVYYADACQALPPRGAKRRFPSPRDQTPTVRVKLDEDRLGRAIAAGVVDGFRRARAEQRQKRRR